MTAPVESLPNTETLHVSPLPAIAVRRVGRYFMQKFADHQIRIDTGLAALRQEQVIQHSHLDARYIEELEEGNRQFVALLNTMTRAERAAIVPFSDGYDIDITPAQEEPEDDSQEVPIPHDLAPRFASAIAHKVRNRLMPYSWAELIGSHNGHSDIVKDAVQSIVQTRNEMVAAVEEFSGADEIVTTKDTIQVITYKPAPGEISDSSV